MTTAVGIMDRDTWRARTDVLVVADPRAKQLLWVPRDLWCEQLRNRINTAFAAGGHTLLAECLGAVGIEADHTLVLLRQATKRLLDTLTVTVPVWEPLRLWYPDTPWPARAEGWRPVDFDPPFAVLSGDDLHAWIGARRSRTGPGSDLDRVRRQQVFLAALLAQGVDLSPVLDDPERARVSHPAALDELRGVDGSWAFRSFDRVVPREIDGKLVLVAGTPEG